MRRFAMMVAAAAVLGSTMIDAGTSRAEAASRYCAMLSTANTVIRDCGYSTWEQCQATASGMGYCIQNPAYGAAPSAAPRKRR